MTAYLTKVKSSLAHPYRSDREKSGHFASILQPITLTITNQEIIVQVRALQDCPDQVRDHYTAEEFDTTTGEYDHWFLISSGTLVFWTMHQDYLHIGLSFAEVKASVEMVYEQDWEECPF